MLTFVSVVVFVGDWRRLFSLFGRTCDACDVRGLVFCSYPGDLLSQLLNHSSRECIFLLQRVDFVVSLWLPFFWLPFVFPSASFLPPLMVSVQVTPPFDEHLPVLVSLLLQLLSIRTAAAFYSAAITGGGPVPRRRS